MGCGSGDLCSLTSHWYFDYCKDSTQSVPKVTPLTTRPVLLHTNCCFTFNILGGRGWSQTGVWACRLKYTELPYRRATWWLYKIWPGKTYSLSPYTLQMLLGFQCLSFWLSKAHSDHLSHFTWVQGGCQTHVSYGGEKCVS